MKQYDVVLYGAGGFTGKQTVAYFSRHAPPGLRWALAGRHRDKLEAARAESGAHAAEILIADSDDQATVDAVVSRTRLVLSTAGPFALYGTPVVDACVRFATHYVDITGETPWVHDLIARYHERAAAAGTRIIPCCGFDSVPSDLGAFLMARHMQALGVPCVEVRGYFQLSGGLNGGTIASLMNLLTSDTGSRPGGPFMLDPPTAHGSRQTARSRALMAPRYDVDIGTWIGPFFMAPINTRIVRRSAALFAEWQEPYGPEFVYQEALKYKPPLARCESVDRDGRYRRVLRRRQATAHAPADRTAPAEAGLRAFGADHGSRVVHLRPTGDCGGPPASPRSDRLRRRSGQPRHDGASCARRRWRSPWTRTGCREGLPAAAC